MDAVPGSWKRTAKERREATLSETMYVDNRCHAHVQMMKPSAVEAKPSECMYDTRMNACIHAYMHAHMHANTHAYIHASKPYTTMESECPSMQNICN